MKPAGSWTSKPRGEISSPAVCREKVGDRADRVGLALPNVAPTVALEIDGVDEVARGHELCLPRGSRPRSPHGSGGNVAVLENDKGRQQLVAEVVAAKADVSEIGQGPNDIVRSGKSAEVGLQSPDPQDDARVDAIDLARFGEPSAPRLRLVAAALDARGRNRGGNVVPYRTYELGLPVRVGHDLRVEGDAGKSVIEGFPRNAALRGKRPNRCDKLPKRPIARPRRPFRRSVHREDEATRKQQDHA